jgi:hypothetical protein
MIASEERFFMIRSWSPGNADGIADDGRQGGA